MRFDKITDLRNMQIFDKVYQTGVSGGLRCCTHLADTDMLRCLTSVKNCLKSHLFSFHIGAMSTLNFNFRVQFMHHRNCRCWKSSLSCLTVENVNNDA